MHFKYNGVGMDILKQDYFQKGWCTANSDAGTQAEAAALPNTSQVSPFLSSYKNKTKGSDCCNCWQPSIFLSSRRFPLCQAICQFAHVHLNKKLSNVHFSQSTNTSFLLWWQNVQLECYIWNTRWIIPSPRTTANVLHRSLLQQVFQDDQSVQPDLWLCVR